MIPPHEYSKCISDNVERIIKSRETLMGPRCGVDLKLKFYWCKVEMTQKTYSGVSGSACTPHCQNIEEFTAEGTLGCWKSSSWSLSLDAFTLGLQCGHSGFGGGRRV